MKSLENYVIERGAAPRVDLVYAVILDDGTIYNYGITKSEAQKMADVLNDEAPSNKAKIQPMKRSDLIKEQFDTQIDEGLRELSRSIKMALGIPVPDNTKEVYDELVTKVDDIADNIKKFDLENGEKCKVALREFVESINAIANDLWDKFDDKSEQEKQKILTMWQKAEVVYNLIYAYADKLHSIIDIRDEMNS